MHICHRFQSAVLNRSDVKVTLSSKSRYSNTSFELLVLLRIHKHRVPVQNYALSSN